MGIDSGALDRVDRRILQILQVQGRLSNVELSRQVNLSPAPCLARVRRLEQRGFIRGARLFRSIVVSVVVSGLSIGISCMVETTVFSISGESLPG